MFENIKNLEIGSSLTRINRPQFNIKNRKTHSFFFRIRGSIRYDFPDRSFLVKEGEMMFVPKGSTYEGTAFSPDSRYFCIYFNADFSVPPQPFSCSLENFQRRDELFRCFPDVWTLGSEAEKYHCISLVYELLSYLSHLENITYAEKHKFPMIDSAIAYLRDHIYDPELRVSQLHRLSGISNTYFRQIFVSKFGVTPQSYILSKRLSQAKMILNSGDYHTVGEVALSVGFQNPLYFSKMFKKAYGTTPSEAGK